jgi:hypothetical protein
MDCPIVRNYGMERIKARSGEWLKAMSAGWAAATKCGAPTMTGEPCRKVPLRGGRLCANHLHAEARDALDATRAIAAQKRLRSTTNARHRREAEVALANIARRNLLRMWRKNPTLPGETFVLPAREEQRVARWLRDHHGIILGETRHDDCRPLNPKCIDQLRWASALCLTARITPDQARRRVTKAMRKDTAWWRQHPDVEV